MSEASEGTRDTWPAPPLLSDYLVKLSIAGTWRAFIVRGARNDGLAREVAIRSLAIGTGRVTGSVVCGYVLGLHGGPDTGATELHASECGD